MTRPTRASSRPSLTRWRLERSETMSGSPPTEGGGAVEGQTCLDAALTRCRLPAQPAWPGCCTVMRYPRRTG
jgi:hypothetical protein